MRAARSLCLSLSRSQANLLLCLLSRKEDTDDLRLELQIMPRLAQFLGREKRDQDVTDKHLSALFEECIDQQAPRRKAERGFFLLEMLVALAILGVVLAMAVPQLVQLRKARQTAAARTRVLQVWSLEGESQVCHQLGGSCQGIDAMLPVPQSSVEGDGYTYTMSAIQNGQWTYIGTPTDPTMTSWSISNTGQLSH